jgi:nitrite reductase/ring-hydroxylating ferredoxin subunit
MIPEAGGTNTGMAANEIARRRALIVIGAITPCFMACVAPPVGTAVDDIDDPRDPDDDGGSPGKQDDPSTPSGDDAAPVADDTGAPSSASDTGVATTDTGASGGAADTGGGATGGGSTPVACPSLTDAGAVTSLPMNTWRRMSGTAVFILGHDSGGIYAYSAKCTHHTSVTIGTPNSSGVATCPSHGAQFDSNGNVIRGPATSALKHYAVTICGGKIYVDTSKTVSASTRA